MVDEPNYSKHEIGDMVQRALDICATCAHTAGDHDPGTGNCRASWLLEGSEMYCDCLEFWEAKAETIDGLAVIGYECGVSGSFAVPKNSRPPSEFWDSLEAGEVVRVVLDVEVDSKGYKLARSQGEVIGATETRKTKIVRAYFGKATGAEWD